MQDKNLGWFRKKFFPIHNDEMRSIVLFNLLFFLAAGSYGMLRAMKETYVTAVGGSSLVLWVKLAVVIPVVFFFKYVYDTIGSRTTANNCVYAMMGYFLAFFLLFYFILNPYFVDKATAKAITSRAKEEKRNLGLLEMLRLAWAVWPSILFYAHAEGFGTYSIGVITWGFANRVVSKAQSPRWYITFSIGTGIATILAGTWAYFWYKQPGMIFGAICSCIALFIAVYWYFAKGIEETPEKFQIFPKKAGKKKKKLGFLASTRALLASKDRKHLSLILVLVLAYSFLICLFEATFKDWVNGVGDAMVKAGKIEERKHFVTQLAGKQLMWIGIASILFSLFLASPVRRRGWKFTALVVPGILLTGSMFFFATIKQANYLEGMGWDKLIVLNIVLYIGLTVVINTKSGKYVFVDSTTNGAYGPLDAEAKRTGKSAVDGVGSRLGKASGAIFILVLTNLTGAPALELIWIIGLMMLIGCGIWIAAVFELDVILSKARNNDQKKRNSNLNAG